MKRSRSWLTAATSVERHDLRADRDLAALDDPRPEAGPVDERPEDRLGEEVGQVLAWLAQPRPFADGVADAEPPTDEVVEPDAPRRHVPPGLAGREDDPVGRGEILDHLGLDERDVPVDAEVRRPVAVPGRVAVA